MSRGFVWFDLATPDPEAAIAFYTRVVGWTTKVWPGDLPYTMFHAGETGIGGVVPLAPGVRPYWLGYIGVDDVDQAVAKATAHGASVLSPPTDIEATMRYAVLADPQEAAIAVFSSSRPPPPEGPPQLGDLAWAELYTTDWRAASSFYEAVFGWRKTDAMEMGPHGTYQMFAYGSGPSRGGIMNRPPEMTASAWTYYFRVDDVHARTKLAESLGAKIMNGPMEVPGGDWITQGMDPQGAMFAIHSPKKG